MDKKGLAETPTGYDHQSIGFYSSGGDDVLPSFSSRADLSKLCLFYLTRAMLLMYLR